AVATDPCRAAQAQPQHATRQCALPGRRDRSGAGGTGRLYGATTYSKLLRNVAPQAGIERSPSSSTVQAAVLRAQSFAGAQPGTGSGEAEQTERTQPIGASR